MKSEPGSRCAGILTAAAQVRLIVWCLDCRHQVEPDPRRRPSASRRDDRPGLVLRGWSFDECCSQCMAGSYRGPSD